MLNAGRDARTLAGIPVEVRWAPVAPAAAGVASPANADPADSDELARDVLTASEFTRYRALRPDAARAFLAGRRLLRELVASLASVDPAEVSIGARCPVCGGRHGRPAVVAPQAATPLQLSLAHTDSLVVAAAAWDHAVGVDVERADAVHTAERDRAIASVAGASGDNALAHWTRVEAVLKADGRGLRIDPRTVRVTGTGEVVEARIDDADARYELAELDLGPGYAATVAVRR